MARYFINGGINNNWGDTSNWSDTSGGAGGFSVPTSSDDVYLDGNSPNCVVNASNRVCLSIDFTGYVNTFSEDSTARTLTVSGNVTLGSGATYTFAGTLIVNATATLTSNGATWSGNLTLPTALSTTTFADNWYIVGNYSASNTTVEGGKTISVEGNVSTPINNGVPTSFCTVKFVGSGTQTFSTLGAIRMNVLIDKSGGSLTMLDASASGIRMFAPSFVVAGTNSGTIAAPNLISFNVASTIDTSAINWNDVTIAIAGGHTLSSALNIYGTLRYTAAVQMDGSDVNIYGSFDYTVTGNGTGTSNFYFLGTATGTWVHSGSGAIRNNITINKGAGTLTIGTNIRFNTGTLTYTSGTVTATGSTLTIADSVTLDTDGITWNNIQFTQSSTVTITLSSDLTMTGTLTVGSSGFQITIDGADIYVGGSLTVGGTTSIILGSANIIFNGTGTWSSTQSSTGNFRLNVTFNTAGIITVSGNIQYRTGTITYTAGTIVTTGSTLNLRANATLNTNGMTWDNVTMNFAAMTLTINSLLSMSGILTLGSFDIVMDGTAGFYCSTLSMITALTVARSLTLKSTIEYIVYNSVTITGARNTFRYTIKSGTPSTKAILTLSYGANQNVGYTNATDIDSSLGQTVYSFNAVLNNTINWNTLTYPKQNNYTY